MRAGEPLSESIQDYLKAIYQLASNGQPTSTNELAERLGVAPASVTGMLKRLAAMQPALVVYQKHHGVQLTEEGQRISLQIIRNHRLIELFLVQILGYSWDEVHPEAERLEHAVSFRFGERLAQLLGEPDFDPHGDPIPDRNLNLPNLRAIPLSQVPAGQRVITRRVNTSDAALLRYLGELGLYPGARVEVLAVAPFGGPLTLRLGGSEHALGREVAGFVSVAGIQ